MPSPTMTPITKHKRFSTSRKVDLNSSPYILDDWDQRILLLVYEYRFLTTELLWHLLNMKDRKPFHPGTVGKDGKRRPVRYGFGQQALYKHLQKLVRARYLNRIYLYQDPRTGRKGGPKAVYCLGPRSTKVVPPLTGITAKEVHRIVDANRVQTPFLRHSLGITAFRVILIIASSRSDKKVSLLFWEQGRRLKDTVAGRNERGKTERFSVYPDAFFGLDIDNVGKRHFFLEIDRGTEPIVASNHRTDIRKKLFGYYHYRRTGRFARRNSYLIPPNEQVGVLGVVDRPGPGRVATPDRPYGPRGFRVLFLVSERALHEGYPAHRVTNIIDRLPRLDRSFAKTSLFWLTVPDRFDINSPQSIFSRVWRTSKSATELRSLLD